MAATSPGVAELIDHSNQRTEDSINERRVTLDSLVATLDIRTEDLDQRLKRFSGLLDESLEAASARAREIARVVSESSAEGSRAISEQYERVREPDRRASERRRRDRRQRDARAIYRRRPTGDTHALFRDANERFAETVQGMKQMAAEMQRELEATAPSCAAASSSCRRRPPRAPRKCAASSSTRSRRWPSSTASSPATAAISTRSSRGVRAREESALAVGRRPQRRAAAAPGSARTTSAASRRPPAAPKPPSLSPAQSSVARTGWLTDLLSRASREEDEPRSATCRARPRASRARAEERTPRHSIESLDSLSVDIARMIDHDAAADLWDRYKRGERNVFTRRLYTLQGQQAFDEIRKKYRADREFKQTVDRYIGEFERLLDEVSRDDRGQVVARTYLTSETGKVYTMLAHAAGRFD